MSPPGSRRHLTTKHPCLPPPPPPASRSPLPANAEPPPRAGRGVRVGRGGRGCLAGWACHTVASCRTACASRHCGPRCQPSPLWPLLEGSRATRHPHRLAWPLFTTGPQSTRNALRGQSHICEIACSHRTTSATFSRLIQYCWCDPHVSPLFRARYAWPHCDPS